MWARLNAQRILREDRQQLLGEPAGREEIEMPAELGAARVEPLDARPHRFREARLGRLHRRDIDAHAAHAELVHVGEQRVRRILVDVHDAAAARDPDLAHRVEHAGIVAAIGARLHEHEALDAEVLRERQIVGERRERRRVAQLLVHAAVRIALRRSEHMEMRVAGIRRRAEGGRGLVRGASLDS